MSPPARPAVVVVDNYDSFTFNLVQLLAGLAAAAGRSDRDAIAVVRNDALDAHGVLALDPGAVLLSPGPGLPRDAGVCLELTSLAPTSLPIFGVCLGMQILAEAEGARLVRAKEILHGRTSTLTHGGRGCFEGLPEGLRVMRYHSWQVDQASLPPHVEATAWADDDTLMGLRETARPREAVQFHPESFLTEHGPAMLARFVAQGIARTR